MIYLGGEVQQGGDGAGGECPRASQGRGDGHLAHAQSLLRPPLPVRYAVVYTYDVSTGRGVWIYTPLPVRYALYTSTYGVSHREEEGVCHSVSHQAHYVPPGGGPLQHGLVTTEMQ